MKGGGKFSNKSRKRLQREEDNRLFQLQNELLEKQERSRQQALEVVQQKQRKIHAIASAQANVREEQLREVWKDVRRSDDC